MLRKVGRALTLSRHAVGEAGADDFERAGGQSRMQFILRQAHTASKSPAGTYENRPPTRCPDIVSAFENRPDLTIKP